MERTQQNFDLCYFKFHISIDENGIEIYNPRVALKLKRDASSHSISA